MWRGFQEAMERVAGDTSKAGPIKSNDVRLVEEATERRRRKQELMPRRSRRMVEDGGSG